MRLTWRDAVATVLVAAIMVPYAGYLINGSALLITDPTGMAALGLILGAIAVVVGGWIAVREGAFMNTVTLVWALISFGLGFSALVSENIYKPASREIILWIFIATIVGLWALALLRHTGFLPAETQPTSRLGGV
ncbi:MAG TPA: hypothetical protein VFQ25_02260 [Ktedonobacterales bacterium]|nr:hypothetical protein [Ktedonobacterales bacterium]